MSSCSGSSYSLPSNVSDSFHTLIDNYNSEKTVAEDKTNSLNKINELVHDVLKGTSAQAVAPEVKKLLQQIKVQPKDRDLWNQITGEIDKASPIKEEIEKASPNIRIIEMLEAADSMDVYSIIMGIIEKLEG